ncbi:MAG: DMT family transporter [Lachnospiraceae bacterium]
MGLRVRRSARRLGTRRIVHHNAVRFAVGALSLVPVILIFERGKSTPEQRKRTVMYGVIAGVVLFSAANLQQFGILFTQSAGKSAFITGLYTVLVPIVYAFCGKKTGINVWIGAALTVGGLYLLCGSYGSLGLGDLLLFIGTAFWTAHIITLDRAGHGVRAIRFSCIQFSVCAILGFICAFIFEEVRLDAIRAGCADTLRRRDVERVAYTATGQRDADPTAASIVLSAMVWAAIGGALSCTKNDAPAIGGCVLIFCGIVLSQIVIGRKKNPDAD